MASSNQPYPYSGSGTKPSPPSPSSSSPGLTQSTSNSSCSPPQPSTPPRRQKPRQSDQGRIPLHRRGTSRTYENLEDLLREAGYKETRIYTPDSDRVEPHARDEEGGRPAGKAQGVRAAVVGFLTGLVTGTGNDAAGPNLRQDQATSNGKRPRLYRTQSPSSPLQQVTSYRREHLQSVESLEPRTPMTSSIESLGDPTPRADRRQTLLHRQHQVSSQPSTPHSPEERSSSPVPRCPAYNDHHSQDRSLLPHHSYQHQHPRTSTAPSRINKHPSWSPITTPSNNNVTSPDSSPSDPTTSSSNNSTIVINDPAPSRAGTYLRHVMSTPPIVPSKSLYRNSSNSGAEGAQAQSRTWLDSVARVLMFGASTTPLGYTISPTPDAPTPNIPQSSSALTFPSPIQRPSSFNHQHHHLHHQHQDNHHQHHPHHRTLRPSRSSISQTTYRSALSASTTMTTRPRLETRGQQNLSNLSPPVFLTRFGRERAPCSQSQVSRTRVYCRSAPASRASSPNRSTSYFYNKNENSNNKKNGLRDISNTNSGGGRVGKGSGKRGHYHTHGGGATTDSRRRIGRRKKGDEECTKVPTLAKTRVEGDGWHKGGGKSRILWVSENNDPFSSSGNHYNHHHHHHHHRHQSPRHDHDNDGEDGDKFCEHEGDDDDDDDDDTEDDEEGELDLAKMLVNPKRQQSIRSLRKHLHHSKQLLTSPTTLIESSKAGDLSSNVTQVENSTNASITNPSLSRLHVPSHHFTTTTTTQPPRRRFVSERQTRQGDDDTAGQWERQWRSGELSSSRRGSEDDDLYESLTWLNDDQGGNSKRKNNGLRSWNSNSALQGPR